MKQDVRKIRVRVPHDEKFWELASLETSPCTLACPTRINARGYVSLVSDGRFREALALIRARNPFPGVCGRVCPRPCEAACTRGDYDEPIAICALKRFVFDLEMKRGIDPAAPARIHRNEKVAVIGAGPAGLSAARELALRGYPVTIFEARDGAGGMMNLIPEFRLPRMVVKREARAILDMGIELVTGTAFGKDITWNQLKRRGYQALLVATGAWQTAWKWGAAGMSGVWHAVDFLQHAALEIEDRRVAVAGDGMMALDCARTAVRLGASRVTFVVGRSRVLAPVHQDDLDRAEREGVRALFLARPSKLVTRGTKLAGVKFVKLKEEAPDATGRRAVLEISGSEFAGDFDIFIDSYTRGIDIESFASNIGLSVSALGTVLIDPETGAAGTPGVFAAGDLVAGPRSVVEAIASGQKAAYAIHHYLSGETTPSPFDLTMEEAIARREYTLERAPESAAPRLAMPVEEVRTRKLDFREVEKGYGAQEARREAQRCMRCGPCSECEVCVDMCEKKDFLLRVSEDFLIPVHAGREFWSPAPERVILEVGGERAEASPIRTICSVDEDLCIACGRCQEVCGYKAVQVETQPGGRFIAHIDELACKGCGACVTVCPSGAIDQRNFEHEEIVRKLGSIAPGRTNVLFVCHWARPGRLDLPSDVLVVETMCAGRVTPQLIMEAVLRGSPKVLVCGCSEETCRYVFGKRQSERVLEQCRRLLRLFGFKPEIVAARACTPDDFALAVNTWAGESE